MLTVLVIKECLDKCCGYYPEIKMNNNLVIYCSICGDGVESNNIKTPLDQVKVMGEWNKKKRQNQSIHKSTEYIEKWPKNFLNKKKITNHE